METLFSLLGLYQLLAIMLPGAVVGAGAYYAIAGLPPDPSTAAVLGLIVLFYIVGNAVQGTAVVWEAPYWARSGGWPSTRRMTPSDSKAYDEAFRQLIQTKLDAVAGVQTAAMPISERLGLARAELRRQGQDTRSESFNATYGLSRGLVTGAVVVAVVMLICAIVGHAAERNLIAAAIVAATTVPIFNRFRRFGFYFADQIWRDFAALPLRSE
jgi:hypothetical protein